MELSSRVHSLVLMAETEGKKRTNCFQAGAPVCNFVLEKGFASAEAPELMKAGQAVYPLKSIECEAQDCSNLRFLF